MLLYLLNPLRTSMCLWAGNIYPKNNRWRSPFLQRRMALQNGRAWFHTGVTQQLVGQRHEYEKDHWIPSNFFWLFFPEEVSFLVFRKNQWTFPKLNSGIFFGISRFEFGLSMLDCQFSGWTCTLDEVTAKYIFEVEYPIGSREFNLNMKSKWPVH